MRNQSKAQKSGWKKEWKQFQAFLIHGSVLWRNFQSIFVLMISVCSRLILFSFCCCSCCCPVLVGRWCCSVCVLMLNFFCLSSFAQFLFASRKCTNQMQTTPLTKILRVFWQTISRYCSRARKQIDTKMLLKSGILHVYVRTLIWLKCKQFEILMEQTAKDIPITFNRYNRLHFNQLTAWTS